MSIRPSVVILAVIVGSACGTPAPHPHHEVVVVTAPNHAQDAGPRIEAWMRAHLTTAGSTIQVCAPEQCLAPVVAPSRWGSNVLRAKAAFADRAARELREAAQHPDRWQPVETIAFPPTPAITAATNALPVDVETWGAHRDVPLHIVLICDRSRSTGTADGCTQASVLALYDQWLRGASAAGSSFTVLGVGTDLASTVEVVAIRTPEGSNPTRLLALLAARTQLAGLNAQGGSAIAEALYLAADRLRLHAGLKWIIVLSDARQVSALADFDRGVPEPLRFMPMLRAAGLAADLRQIRVAFCGANFHRLRSAHASSMAPAQAERARRAAWEAAVTAQGAREVRFITRCCDLAASNFIEGAE